MNSPLIRPQENAYPAAPFFRLGRRTDWIPRYYFAASLFLTAGSTLVYGYGVLIHALMLSAAGMVIAPPVSAFKKNLFFNSLLWNADLLILALLLPVSLPWYSGLIAAPLLLMGARLFMIPETKPLFQPSCLVLVFLLHSFGRPFTPTVFHLMPDASLNAWLEASRALFFSENPAPLRDLPFIIGGPGGSAGLVLILGLLLSAVKALSFSSALIYMAGYILGLLAVSGWHTSGDQLFLIPEMMFTAVFLVQNPAPLEYPKKLLHAFLAAIFCIFLQQAHMELPFFTGVLAANLLVPFWDTLGESLPPPKKAKRPGRRESFITGGIFLALSAAAYMLSRML